ncbi:inhibitor of the pro-sigma K processing machinery [Natranaerovirga pectinivora]|uniref:Inhibitor of the pro-sigma K processing machinery n=1 Tax=Natranaerovirga pectinivora TaxID=682400 RepID=A0A4R3MDW9_9FIRM|nr:pro-sigmaK processing inhibitor BofA family protein [Natranaerovirga pectinivora]TCT11656.1 inhibitor of the pro-sigma K processing machinery [Natranaerovirga pectinivora]
MLTDSQVLLIIIIGCLLIMGISIVVKKTHLVVNFFLKSVVGLVGIYLMNELLESLRVNVELGLNVGNALTIGVLGLPGFVLLYLLVIYHNLFK